MNVLGLISAFGKNLNYGKAVEDASKDSGILSSYIRNHLSPAFAALLGLMIVAAGLKWLLDSAFSATATMKQGSNREDRRPRRDDRKALSKNGNRPSPQKRS